MSHFLSVEICSFNHNIMSISKGVFGCWETDWRNIKYRFIL